MAKLTLQEQLLKSGLVGIGQARSAKAEMHKQAKQNIKDDAVKAEAKKAKLEQAERDRELNKQRKEQETRNQLAAQIKQLIEHNRQPVCDNTSDLSEEVHTYHFTDNNKVKTLYVTKAMREKLMLGHLAIVKFGKGYEVVPTEIADKIKLRDTDVIIVLNTQNLEDQNKDDPYAAFQVPDDLTW